MLTYTSEVYTHEYLDTIVTMDNYTLIPTSGEPGPDEKKTIVAGMLAYHRSKGHIRKEKDDYFSVVLKYQDNTVGAIVVSFRWDTMHIETLWIDESIRGKGWGTRLVEAAEKEAITRNCYLAYTDTFSWQAPKFYEKLGYTLYSTLDNYPRNCSLSYFKKDLNTRTT